MANISAQMVKELRERTGAGMMDCKAALQETSGDMEQAVDLLRKKGLEGAVNVRQFGGTTEIAAAFQHKQIAGAVISALRVNAPMRMLVDLSELDFLYSNVVIAVTRDFQRRAPEAVGARDNRRGRRTRSVPVETVKHGEDE